MKKQNQIKRTLSQPENIEYIQRLLDGKQFRNRTALASAICGHFDFYDTRGRKQQGSCLKALRDLEAAEHFILPAVTRNKTKRSSPRRLEQPLEPLEGVPGKVEDISELTLVEVCSVDQMRIWNEMMICEHPQGAGALMGRQLRYLIGSEYGWLGGLGFAASALQLEDRDKWIGWDREQRREYLHMVVGMSRFLIRRCVQCKNLASKVLSMSMAVMPDDFERNYKYRPLLVESFVDTSHYEGTCYRAANWIPVGKTKGRGRQDRFNKAELSVKEIYVYTLESDFRARMGLASGAGLGALDVADGVDTENWAENEFGGASLGDARRDKRLVSAAAAQAENPGRAFSGVAAGDWPSVKAYYRMIDQPDDSEVNMTNILKPHKVRTMRRMQGQKTVLCVQDGSDLNYNHLNQCEGLGEIVANQTGATTRGLHLHSTFAVAPNGLPLGILKASCTARKGKSKDDHRRADKTPIEEKKTFTWIEHHRDLVELSARMPNTRLVNVCDREADFYELFDEQRRKPCVELLVRAKHDRNIIVNETDMKLFQTVRSEPVQSRLSVKIPRQSARPKKSRQKARSARPGRMADLTVRYKRIQLSSPDHLKEKGAVDMWVIHAQEENPPENTKAAEWVLLTTVNINSAEDAVRCMRWYCLRWRIEDFHRVLKSGCRIEKLAHKKAERLRRAIAINMVIAWRIMLMTLLGRETPDLPAEVLFSDIELRTLSAIAKKKGFKQPKLLGEAVKLVAKLGGYLDRKNDPPPGHQIMWQGYAVFQFMCMGFELLDDTQNSPAPI